MMDKRKDEATGARDYIAAVGAKGILAVQRWTMGHLQRGFERIPRRGRIIVMAICFGLSAFVFGRMILRPGKGGGVGRLIESSPPITLPALERDPLEVLVLGRIRRAREYLDSLAQTPQGMAKADSILRLHPNLRDSLALAEDRLK